MERVIALLRGINVGGRNKVPMQELRTVFSALGHEAVRTHAHSGNVVFQPAGKNLDHMTDELEQAIHTAFGFEGKVILRTTRELMDVAAGHPLAAPGIEPAKLHVVFLGSVPEDEAVARLDPERSPPDRFDVSDRHIYVRYPNGAARSKLTADYFERTLGVPATARNWNTVQKLVDMATAA